MRSVSQSKLGQSKLGQSKLGQSKLGQSKLGQHKLGQSKLGQHKVEPTRERLLRAALDIFGEKGFQAATIAEICGAAEANIAAVNYHFGDKAGLYRDAWRHAFDEALEAFPFDGGVAVDAGPEDRLRAHVRSLIYRMGAVGPAGSLQGLYMQEQLNPTGLVRAGIGQPTGELRDHLLGAIRELMGADADDEDVRLCAHSVIAQCRSVLPVNRREHKLFKHRDLDEALIEQLAAHVARFSIAGIRGCGR